MLGFTQAVLRVPEFLDTAVAVTDWWLQHVPLDMVSFWDFDDPDIPDAVRDTSATAIAAVAMVKLAPLGGGRYRDAAVRTVDALASGHIGEHGGLIHGYYNRIKNVAVCNELIWGDYFLARSGTRVKRPRRRRRTLTSKR